ncbi:MAG: hypothetical protein SGI77_01375 [Pirellulaceae bacterium]|nr:hypothetical protein [Pirellulaceae bacterium]
MSVLFLTKDLMFSSRVSACAQTLEIDLSVVSDQERLLASAAREQAQLVLLDLSTPGLDPMQIVPQLRQLAFSPKAIVAYGPHVHEAKLAAAQEAGCDEVLARGAFNNRMAKILASHVTVASRAGDVSDWRMKFMGTE